MQVHCSNVRFPLHLWLRETSEDLFIRNACFPGVGPGAQQFALAQPTALWCWTVGLPRSFQASSHGFLHVFILVYEYSLSQNPVLREACLCGQATSSSVLGAETFSRNKRIMAPIMQHGLIWLLY